MRRRTSTALLAAFIASNLTAGPVGAQIAGLTTLEPEVIDPGAEPRQELRYAFTEGQNGTMAMDMTMALTNDMDGTSLLDTTFDVSMEVDMTVTDVYDDGSARIEQTFTVYDFPVTGDAVADAELESMSDQLTGVTVWQVIDDQGALLDLGSDEFDGLPAELRQQVLDSTVAVQPLPAEAVGVGARWVSDGSMTSQGVPIRMSVENVVLELAEDHALLDTMISADAEAASAALLEDMPPGVELSIDRLELEGGGTVDVAFDTLIPTSDVTLDVVMGMSVGAEGEEPVQMSMDFGMTMSMAVYPVE